MKRGRKARVSLETWSRVYILRGPLLQKKNVIRELWMICLSWHVEAKSYFSWIVKLDQKSALFFRENGPAVQKNLQKRSFWMFLNYVS